MMGRSARAAAGLVLVLIALAGWYLWAGRGFVARAVAENQRAVLRNLATGDGPFTLEHYLAAADERVVAACIVLAVLVGVLAWWPSAGRTLERVYDGMRRACDWALGRRRTALAVCAAVTVVAVALVAIFVLQDFANSGDEYCYLYQAETFARGRMWNEPHPVQPFFETFHVRQIDGRLFSVFPPAWPAVLAAAMRARFPLWLVNPVLGAVSLLLLFAVGRRLHDERTALVAMVVLATSSVFLFNSASYFAHTLCSVQVLVFAYFGIRTLDERRCLLACAAGATIGTALLTRNFTAVWCGLPFGVALMAAGRFGWKAILAAIAGGAPFVLGFLAYNTATTGHPFTMAMGGGFEAYDERWFPSGWLGRGVEITAGHLVDFVAWTPPALLGLYVWSWRATPSAQRRFTDFIFPCLVVAYFVYVDRGGNHYGPRYYYEAIPFVVLAAVAPLVREPSFAAKDRAGRVAFYAFAVSMLLAVPIVAWHARVESRVVWERREPYRLVEEQHLDNAVVFLGTKAGLARPMSIFDLTRNGTDFLRPVLFVQDLGPRNAELMDFYPGRRFYRYRFDREHKTGVLEPVPVPVMGR